MTLALGQNSSATVFSDRLIIRSTSKIHIKDTIDILMRINY